MKEPQKLVETEGLDLAMFGQRLRHTRRAKGLTLADLGARVGRTPSVLSLIENGRREPRLSLVEQIANALDVPVTELLKKQPPSRRAQLEIALEHAQRDPSYRALGLPELRVGTRVPTEMLEHLVALAAELRAQRAKPTATPEEARAANAALRGIGRPRLLRSGGGLGPLRAQLGRERDQVLKHLGRHPGADPQLGQAERPVGRVALRVLEGDLELGAAAGR